MSNDISLIEVKNPLQVFSTPKGLDAIIDKIESEVKSIDRDISTAAGRENIRSIAFKLAKSKNALDKMGKELTEKQREEINAVNAERSRAWDRMEALQAEIRKPLTDWEEADEARVAAHEAALGRIVALIDFSAPHTSADILSRKEHLPLVYERPWEEFSERAKKLFDETERLLNERYDLERKAERDAGELERLRKEEAARIQKERDEKIAAEAAETARIEAEKKAKAEADALAEKVRAEKEAALKEKQEAEARAKKAEDDRIASEKRAEQARIDAEVKAKAEAAAAVEKERQRIEAEKKAEADALAKREADQAHKAKINNEALDAVKEIIAAFKETGNDPSQSIIEAIARGKVPHVKITY